MRVAAIYDIHGNLPALEAVLRDIGRLDVDVVVVGGDVLPGPMAREALDVLRALSLPVRYLHGNGDRGALQAREGRENLEIPAAAREAIRWSADQLVPEHAEWIASWPGTLRVEIPGLGQVLFCHATPQSDTEIFTRVTPETRLLPMFATSGAAVVVCGHTHMPFDRMVGGTRVVNAGSVGMPFGEPGADWLLLGPGVEPQHTTYDLADAAARIERTAYPGAAEFAARYVMNPPTESEMLRAFGGGPVAG